MLKPSKIMSWDFTRQLAARNMRRESYSKWRQHEEATKQRSETLKEKR